MGLAVRAQLDGAALSDVLEQLKRCPASLDQVLGRSVAFGVAFHHAGRYKLKLACCFLSSIFFKFYYRILKYEYS